MSGKNEVKMAITRVQVTWACEFCGKEEITDSKKRGPARWVKPSLTAPLTSANKFVTFDYECLVQEFACDTCFPSLQDHINKSLKTFETQVINHILFLKSIDPNSEVADSEIKELFDKYITNVKREESDEWFDQDLLWQVESNVPIAASRSAQFRKELVNYIGSLAIEGKKFGIHDSEKPLLNALRLTVLEQKAMS